LRYLLQIVGSWFAFLIVSIILAGLTNWNELLVGLTVGVIVGFLPSFSLAVLDNSRSWNIENIEKIYAPLIGEITNLQTYLSSVKQLSPGTLFDYGESRDHLLSMAVWNRIHEDNIAYRLRLDDRKLAEELDDFYFVLPFYIKNRERFISSSLDPVLNKLLRPKDINLTVNDLIDRIKGAIRNLVLDAFDTSSGEILLGFYANFTNLFPDFEQAKIYTDVSGKTFFDFLKRVGEEIKDDGYASLLEQRRNLYKNVLHIRPKIERKLEKARPT
jgi:hypothetical protein